MANWKCPSCRSKIDTAAVKCPFCQHELTEVQLDEAKQSEKISTAIGGVIVVGLIVALIRCSAPAAPPSVETPELSPQSATPYSAPSPSASIDLPNWSYTSEDDAVRKATSYFATATSQNRVYLDFPYNGGSTLSMTVRKSPAYGTDVYFQISRGQINCHAYDGCYAMVRFDDHEPVRFSMVEPSDYDSSLVFIERKGDFIKRLKGSQRVVIELELYQSGRPQFQFNTGGLKWEH